MRIIWWEIMNFWKTPRNRNLASEIHNYKEITGPTYVLELILKANGADRDDTKNLLLCMTNLSQTGLAYQSQLCQVKVWVNLTIRTKSSLNKDAIIWSNISRNFRHRSTLLNPKNSKSLADLMETSKNRWNRWKSKIIPQSLRSTNKCSRLRCTHMISPKRRFLRTDAAITWTFLGKCFCSWPI